MYTRFTIFLLIFSFGLGAIEIHLNDNPLSVQVLRDEPLSIRMTFGSFTYNEVEIDGETWALPYLGGESLIMEKGMPQLPQIVRSVIIPGDRKPDLIITDWQSTTVKLRVAPSKGHFSREIDPDTVPYEFGEFYRSPDIADQPVVTLSDPYILRDYRGVAVQFKPFFYNPAEGTLTITTSIEVELHFDQPAQINPMARVNNKSSRAFEEIYRNHFLNQPNTRYDSVLEEGRMIVISYDDFMDEVAPLVQWKIEKGIQTDLYSVDTIGNTDTAIGDFIQDQYDMDDGLTWVLLVGDALQVDTPSYSGGGADPMYALVDGNDSYPDIFIGRLSAQTEGQVDTQIERLIGYERDITSGDWMAKGVGIASELGNGIGDDGESDWVHMDLIRDDFLGFNYTQVDQIYATTGATDTMVSNALNEGRGVVNYCGHGSTTSWGTTGFNYADINNLTNDNMLPFIVSVACKNGNFVSYTCFAEYWMRATHNGQPTGAIGIYASSINQEWAPPMAAQDEIADLLVREDKYTFGGLCYNGSCLMIDEYSYWGPRMYNTWHIFGDPSMQVRTQTPIAMNVVHETMLPVGSGSMTIDTDTEGAVCCLTDGSTIIAVTETDANGDATLSFDPYNQPADLLLTVTAPDRIAYQAVIQVGDIPPVTGLTIAISDGAVHLNWDAVPGASSYKIYSLSRLNGFSSLRGTVSQPEWTDSSQYERRFYYITAVFD